MFQPYACGTLYSIFKSSLYTIIAGTLPSQFRAVHLYPIGFHAILSLISSPQFQRHRRENLRVDRKIEQLSGRYDSGLTTINIGQRKVIPTVSFYLTDIIRQIIFPTIFWSCYRLLHIIGIQVPGFAVFGNQGFRIISIRE